MSNRNPQTLAHGHVTYVVQSIPVRSLPHGAAQTDTFNLGATMSDRDNAYMLMLDAIQTYVQTVEGTEYYARDWILITGIQSVNDTTDTELRIDHSPNTTPWTINGLMGTALDHLD